MKKSSFLFTIFILVTSLISSVLAYARIVEIERPRFTFLENFLAIGDHKFLITSHDQCVGEFVVQVKKEQAAAIKSTGVVRTKINNKPIDTKLDGEFYFNPLGQMTDALIKLNSLNLDLVITTKEINPIKTKVILNAFGKKHEIETQISGPILANEYTPGHLRIEYNQRSAFNALQIESPTSFIKNEYDLDIKPNELSASCPTKAARINLDKIIPAIQTISKLQMQKRSL